MKQRLNVREVGQNALKTLYGIGSYLKASPIEQKLRELVYVRVSQINACAYCLDLHSKDARANGETEQRLYGLSAWRETPYYTDRERAALAWAEAVTGCNAPDDIYALAKQKFSDEELVDLTLAVTGINTWNRINISFPDVPGSYILGQFRIPERKSM
ncbi:MAG: carboxymuconolactone decarboxylase family protein [Sediminicola sp.]